MNAFTLLFISLFLTISASAAEIIVTNHSDSGPGSLREAIASASDGDTITFNPSLSGQKISLQTELFIEKAISIDASTLANGLIIDGGSNGDFILDSGETRCFTIVNPMPAFVHRVDLTGLTIQNGISSINGGNIFSFESALTLTDCKVLNGRCPEGTNGAGIYNSGRLILINSTVSHNYILNNGNGGGIYSSRILRLENSTVSHNQISQDGSGAGIFGEFSNSSISYIELINSAVSHNQIQRDGDGGGICCNSRGGLELTNSTVSHNQIQRDGDGGGICGKNSVFTFIGSTISENQTHGNGGGIFNSPPVISSSNFTNCTIANNSAKVRGQGGGLLFVSAGGVSIRNCTITGNSAYSGSGISDLGPDSGFSTVRLTATIVKDNLIGKDIATPINHTSSFRSGGRNLIGSVSSQITVYSSEIFTDDLRLAPLGFYGGSTQTRVPLANSPTIDAAGTANPGGMDQRGFSRFTNGLLDIGAVEARTPVIITNSNDSGPGSLRAAITSAPSTGQRIIIPGNFPVLNISLTSGEIIVPANTDALFIDASATSPRRILGASHMSRVLKILPGSTVALNSLIIGGGSVEQNAPDHFGGAILNDHSTLTLNDSLVNNNFAANGGAIYNDGSFGTASLYLNQTTLSNNSASNGGAISNNGSFGTANLYLNHSTLSENSAQNNGGGIDSSVSDGGRSDITLKHSTLSSNSTNNGSGGGIYSFSRDNGSTILQLNHSTLSNNSSANNGGGINLSGQDHDSIVLNLDRSTFFHNSATFSGGGISSSGSGQNNGNISLTLDHSTFAHNSANNDGGGIKIDSNGLQGRTTLTLNHSTLAKNAANFGGGISSFGANSNSAVLTLNNSIIATNTASFGPDIDDSFGNTISTLQGTSLLSDLNSSGLSASSSILIAMDPLLSPLGHYGGPTQTMHPMAGSPLIDAASTTILRIEDQRGYFRFINEALDIGAVEVGPTITVSNTNDSGFGSLRDAIAQADREGQRILFSPSLSGETIALSSGEITIQEKSPGLFIDASNLTNIITIDAENSSRIFNIRPDSIFSLNSLHLTRGTVQGMSRADYGGAILNDSASLTLNKCHLSRNSAETAGGGISNHGSDQKKAILILNQSTLETNTVSSGLSPFGGGGIYNRFGSLFLNGSSLFKNHSESNGGGIYSGTPNLDTTTDNSVTCRNTTLSQNQAAFLGGGIYSSSSRIALNHTTLAENFVFSSIGVLPAATAGGIHSAFSQVIIGHSIIASNRARGLLSDISLRDSSKLTLQGRSLLSSRIEQSSSALVNGSTPEISSDPLLAPLGNYGGPTLTMPPLADSFAIDANTSLLPGSEDQRGFLRLINGSRDLGAVETGPTITVSNTNDSGAGSLRAALSTATTDGHRILFDPALSGQSIQLSSGALTIPDNSQGLFLDASNIPDGITIDAQNTSRIFNITPDSTVALQTLTLSGGKATGNSFPTHSGGAIFNDHATLTLNNSTLSHNFADGDGGAIYLSGSHGKASLTLNQSTFAENSANRDGGAIFSNGDEGRTSLILNRSTLAYNSANDDGGGISNTSNGSSTLLTLNSSIIASNTSADKGPDLFDLSNNITFTQLSPSLFSNLNDTGLSTDPSLILAATPLIAPLGDYGGPTHTSPPLPGSPALDVGSSFNSGGSDQRGFNRFASTALDIGAVEYQGDAQEFDLTFDLDSDSDGYSNGVEIAIGSDPFSNDPQNPSRLRLTGFDANGRPTMTFGYVNSAIPLRLVRSTDLITFNVVIADSTSQFNGFTVPPIGMVLEIEDSDHPSENTAFYRLEASRP